MTRLSYWFKSSSTVDTEPGSRLTIFHAFVLVFLAIVAFTLGGEPIRLFLEFVRRYSADRAEVAYWILPPSILLMLVLWPFAAKMPAGRYHIVEIHASRRRYTSIPRSLPIAIMWIYSAGLLSHTWWRIYLSSQADTFPTVVIGHLGHLAPDRQTQDSGERKKFLARLQSDASVRWRCVLQGYEISELPIQEAIPPDLIPRDLRSYDVCSLGVESHQLNQRFGKPEYEFWIFSSKWGAPPPRTFVEGRGAFPVRLIPNQNMDSLYAIGYFGKEISEALVFQLMNYLTVYNHAGGQCPIDLETLEQKLLEMGRADATGTFTAGSRALKEAMKLADKWASESSRFLRAMLEWKRTRNPEHLVTAMSIGSDPLGIRSMVFKRCLQEGSYPDSETAYFPRIAATDISEQAMKPIAVFMRMHQGRWAHGVTVYIGSCRIARNHTELENIQKERATWVKKWFSSHGYPIVFVKHEPRLGSVKDEALVMRRDVPDPDAYFSRERFVRVFIPSSVGEDAWLRTH